MTQPKRVLALATLPLLLLAACGDDSKKPASSASPSASASKSASASASTLAKPVTSGNINDVKLDTAKANDPKVTIDKSKLPFGTKDTVEKVIKEGTGNAVGAKDLTKVDFVMVNGTTGKTIESTFGKNVGKFDMSQSAQYPKGIMETIKKHKVGSKVLASYPAKDLFKSAGASQLGIGGNDTVVMYVEIQNSAAPLDEAKGQSQPAPSGMPQVSVPAGKGKEAKITIPSGAKASKSLQQATLIKGSGETIQKGDTISVNYTGQIWGGKVFDSAAKHGGEPASFAIGTGNVIPGWDKALVGKKVGDRVLIVIPPADGYGTQGNSQAGIKGTDTLVFVVDILADYGVVPQQQAQ